MRNSQIDVFSNVHIFLFLHAQGTRRAHQSLPSESLP